MAANRNIKPRVLSLTHERTLMLTRQALLEREGYAVVTASNIQEFRALLLSQSFDLILLCQSVSAHECESAAGFAREHAQSARLMMMINRVGKCNPADADILLDSLSGPKVFVETAHRMLTGNAG